MKRRVAMLLLSLLTPCTDGCPPTPTPDPPPTPSPVPSCATACARAAELDCSWAKPTPAGATCAEVCENAQKLEAWDLGCRTSAASCSDWDGCPVLQ